VYVQNNGYRISTDPSELHLSVIHGYLERSYWAAGIPEEVVRRSIENSLCFGVYRDTEQVGFARVVTDRATFAYLADVFVLEEHRGRGIGKWLVEAILSHPDLRGLRRWMLATRDAHELYRRYGFSELGRPEIFMEIVSPYVAEIDPDPDALDP
jgi:GNAT superfamily N-acetyltransferase